VNAEGQVIAERARPAVVGTPRAERRRRAIHDTSGAPQTSTDVREPGITVEALCDGWRAAFDAADAALRAARWSLPADELRRRSLELAKERSTTLDLLKDIARARGVSARYLHLLPHGQTKRLLGLPASVEACVFNLDGVLIGSATLHAAAWTTTFDEFINARIERTRGQFAPFDPRTDYARYLHGQPRLDGIRAFLASRGISLPEGEPGDPAGAETVRGLANRKNQVLRRRLDEGGVTAYEGSRVYLQTALAAGMHTAVVSASANTATILDRAGLASLIERYVDGDAMTTGHLRPKPAPDALLAACSLLDVAPAHAAAFETTPAGVVAARAAAFATVRGIDQFDQAHALRAAGASPVVPGLAEILDERLAA
jgi:beta-phosphoglucomutase-like phosphatase (HAD superfamily)